MEQRVAMDTLREIAADFETDNASLSRDEVAAARALLRRDQARPLPDKLPPDGEGSTTRRRPSRVRPPAPRTCSTSSPSEVG
ncbi:hypothetical protein E1265_08835 [Streptomyces sp. 8K308]|uniref:hypothetical protein n=1 Tax=Streptomyces sp. 8K308 TaxID=2530388 RepID=UPI00104ACFC4|nr:hypothetical protein [Streptomyces sp. 8K308]TDC24793.1 hypothetical protein E1265_08835 [Streptomyces sp. 8K308]